MLHWNQETSYTKLISVVGDSFVGWGCAECSWLFKPVGPPVGKSLAQMKVQFQAQLSEQFLSHGCQNHRQARAAHASSHNA
jgi:hypothetical protein